MQLTKQEKFIATGHLLLPLFSKGTFVLELQCISCFLGFFHLNDLISTEKVSGFSKS